MVCLNGPGVVQASISGLWGGGYRAESGVRLCDPAWPKLEVGGEDELSTVILSNDKGLWVNNVTERLVASRILRYLPTFGCSIIADNVCAGITLGMPVPIQYISNLPV